MTPEEIMSDKLDDLIAEWHAGAGEGKPLHEYLGMTWEQYGRWVRDFRDLPEGYVPPPLAPSPALTWAEYNR